MHVVHGELELMLLLLVNHCLGHYLLQAGFKFYNKDVLFLDLLLKAVALLLCFSQELLIFCLFY